MRGQAVRYNGNGQGHDRKERNGTHDVDRGRARLTAHQGARPDSMIAAAVVRGTGSGTGPQ